MTVAEFRRFVKATGYVTVAERPLDPAEYPDADPELLVPGSLVFYPTTGPVDLRDVSQLVGATTPGATGGTRRARARPWTAGTGTRSPTSPSEDADAYAAWAGKELPTEAEWEFAARGGLDGAVFAWGDELAPGAGRWPTPGRASSRGRTSVPDKSGTSPVRGFPPNGFGLYDMAGNVWEWTTDYFAAAGGKPRLLRAEEPEGHLSRRQLVPGQPGRAHPAPRHQGRLAPVRPQLLPALPPGRPPGRDGRHLDRHLGFRCILRE